MSSVKVTFGELLRSGNWDQFCEDKGYNIWFINEGLGSLEETVELTVKDAIKYGVIDINKDN